MIGALGFWRFDSYVEATLASEIAATRAMGTPVTVDDFNAMAVGDGGPNAAHYYLAAKDAQRGLSAEAVWEFVTGGTSARAREAGIAQMRTLGPVFARLEQATAIDRCEFQRDWSSQWMPESEAMRDFVRLLGTRAILAAERGRIDVALADLDRMLSLARHISLNEQSMGAANFSEAIARADHATQRVAARYHNDAAVLSRIKAIWEKAPELDLERLLAASSAVFQVRLIAAGDQRSLQRGGWSELEMMGSGSFYASQPTVRRAAGIKFLRAHRKALQAIREEENPRKLMDRLSVVDGELRSDTSPSGVLAVGLMGRDYWSFGRQALMLEVGRRVRMAGLEVMISNAKGEGYPKRLEWIDPFDEQPLRIVRRGKGFGVYSMATEGDWSLSNPDIGWSFPPLPGNIDR